MSETTQAQAPETNAYAQGLNATQVMLSQLIAEANKDAQVIKSAQNQGALISDLIKESDDENVAKYRQVVEETEARLNKWHDEITAYVKANLMPKTDGESDVEAATARYKEKTTAIKQFTEALKILPGNEEILKGLPELTKVGRTGGGANQVGAKRPRVDRIRVSTDGGENWTEVSQTVKDKKNPGDEKVVVSFTVLSNYIKQTFGAKVDAVNLREHAEAVAGDSSEWAGKSPFEYVVSFGDEDKRTHLKVEVTPQNNG